jgi:hypothetical protein
LIVGIGAQRAGSSWLHDYLSKHPQVAASPIKELHFFDAEYRPDLFPRGHNRFARRLRKIQRRPKAGERVRWTTLRTEMASDPDQYFELFATIIGDKQFACEVTPSYAILGIDALKKMRSFLVAAGLKLRIVYVLRDPIDRHRSFTQHYHRRSGRTLDFVSLLGQDKAVMNGRYDQTLPAVEAAFEPEELCVAFYEHIFADPDRHLRQLTDKIGIDYVPPSGERVNGSRKVASVSEIEFAAAMEKFAPAYDYVNSVFGAGKPASWRDGAGSASPQPAAEA